VQNVNDLGIPLYRFAAGYIKPLYLEPIFARREAFKKGWPYSLIPHEELPDYRKGICPVTEKMHEKELIVTAYNYPPLTRNDMDDIVKAFVKAGTMR
jgi:dTDP-4-amino-4,6-dideoxygalactose transaminase